MVIYEAIAIATLILGVMVGTYFLAENFAGRAAREHWQQVRQLRRNRAQQKIAQKQLELERELDLRKRFASLLDSKDAGRPPTGDHAHLWDQWHFDRREEVERAGRYVRDDVIQARNCKTCGQIEMQRVKGPEL